MNSKDPSLYNLIVEYSYFYESASLLLSFSFKIKLVEESKGRICYLKNPIFLKQFKLIVH